MISLILCFIYDLRLSESVTLPANISSLAGGLFALRRVGYTLSKNSVTAESRRARGAATWMRLQSANRHHLIHGTFEGLHVDWR